MTEFKKNELRKGDFAQEFAALASERDGFVVPSYLEAAIRWIAEAESAA
jgi:putative ATP-dependent endonuclease of the OLD family